MHYVAYQQAKNLGKTPDFINNNSEDGLPGGTRTPDLRLRRPLLYPVELRADKKGPGT